jgi:WD40 repeat protein
VVSNDLMISTSSDNLLIIWDLVSGAILKRISYAGGNVAVGSLSYWKNFVVIGSQELAVYLVDIDHSRAVRNYNTNGVVYAVLAVEGYFYVGKRSIPRVVKVRTETGVISKVYSGNTQTVLCLALYNNILFAGDANNLIVSYDEVTAAVLQVLVGHDDRVFCLNIYEDLLYSGGWGNDLVVWNIEDGSIIKKIPFLHRSAITALAVNKDSIFTGSLDTEVSRLNSTSFERLFVYKGKS